MDCGETLRGGGSHLFVPTLPCAPPDSTQLSGRTKTCGAPLGSLRALRLTAERVLIHADTGLHPDLLNSRFGYVSVSRASREAPCSPMSSWASNSERNLENFGARN